MTTVRCFLIILLVTASAAASAAERKSIDAVILMDSSGSMRRTDPRNLRIPAAKLLLRLLEGGDRVGVVKFSGTAQALAGMASLGAHRDGLLAAVEQVDSRGALTNMFVGLQQAAGMLTSSSTSERIIVLMSDGKMDLGSRDQDEASTAALRANLVPGLVAAGIRVYTIAFTEESDQELLRELAVMTKGGYTLARSDQELHLAFSGLFETLASPDRLPIKDSAYTVDEHVREMTVLITKKDPGAAIALAAPSGKRYRAAMPQGGVSWFDSPAFGLATVVKPETGVWNIAFGSGEGDKVFIITDLRLMTSFQETVVPVGATVVIDGRLESGGATILPDLLMAHTNFSARVTTSDNRMLTLALTRDSSASEGRAVAEFLADRPGDYTVRLRAEAPTFTREKTLAFQVVAPAAPVPSEATTTAVVAAPPGTDAAPEQQEQNGVNWRRVVILFALINGLAGLVLALGYAIKRRHRSQKGTKT